MRTQLVRNKKFSPQRQRIAWPVLFWLFCMLSVCAQAAGSSTHTENNALALNAASDSAPRSLGNDRKPLLQYAMSHWSTRDGLPHNSVNSIAQASDGYLWLATWEGPVRFNGRNFEVFDDIEALGVPDLGVMGLAINPLSKDVYIGGPRGGVARFDGTQWQPLPAAPGFVFRVAFDSQRNVWAAAAAGGLIRYDNAGTPHRYALLDSTASDFAYRVYVAPATEGRNEQVWVGTSNGLAFYLPEQDQFVAVPSMQGQQIRALLQHSNGMMLVAAESGLYYQNTATDDFRPWPEAISGVITSLAEGPNNALWFGTLAHGAGRITDRGISVLGVEQGLPNPHVLDIFRDREDNLWLSTHAGLVQLRDALFTSFTRAQGLLGNYARAVSFDSDHKTLWIGTSEGLSIFQGGDQQPLLPVLDNISVLTVNTQQPNVTYVGAYTEGVLQIIDGSVTARFGRSSGLHLAEVRALAFIAELDALLVGTPTGLYVTSVAPGEIELQRTFTLADGLIESTITGISQAPNGDIWVLSTGGISRIFTDNLSADIASWQAVALPLGDITAAHNIFAVRSGLGRTWFATDRGVVVFAEDEYQQQALNQLQHASERQARILQAEWWSVLNRQSGLPFDKYFALVFDFDNNLWLGGSRGVSRVDSASLQQWLTNNQLPVQANHYVETDGMESSQINTGGPAVAIDDEGHIWFATAKGVAVIAPEEVEQHHILAPPIVLERARADGLDIVPGRRLAATVERFEFQYIGLGYRMARHIQYQIKLAGFDSEWIDRGDFTVAEYTALPPGEYTFMVRSRYPGGMWSEPGTISFAKAPHYYQTLWFWLLVAVSLIAVVGLRIRGLERSRQRLRQLVSEQTAALEALANEDPLTKLANRRAFDERIQLEINRGLRNSRPFCIAVLDLDNFKQINDQYLHEGGDQVLTQVATELVAAVRNCDFVARWGGEEFVVLFPETNIEQAHEVCERIRKRIADMRFEQVNPDLQVTTSIGLAQIDAQFNYQALLQRADKALYAAKAAGRNCLQLG